MSRSVLQPSQQKLAEKLTILNDRGVGMLTRLYNIKKVRTGRRGRAGVRRRGQGRGGGGRARPARPGPPGGAAASSESRGWPGGSHFPGRLPGGRREPAGPRMAAAGAWVCGKGERAAFPGCGARARVSRRGSGGMWRPTLPPLPTWSLDFFGRWIKHPVFPPDSMLTFRRISFWRGTGGGSEGGTGFRLK